MWLSILMNLALYLLKLLIDKEFPKRSSRRLGEFLAVADRIKAQADAAGVLPDTSYDVDAAARYARVL